jgi:hypothetical protein
VLENFITQLAEEIHLPPPSAQDPSGYFLIPLTNMLQISVKPLSPGLFITARVGLIPSKKKEDALIYFMKANFLGQGTGGNVLGIDAEEKFLTLSQITPYDVSYKRFKEMIEDFANYLNYWQLELSKLENDVKEGLM